MNSEQKSFENNGPEPYTEVFAWGSDRWGQLGIGNKQGGRCYCIPRFCSFNVIIKNVACGEDHSVFITGKGQIFTFGNNSDGRLGLGEKSIKQTSTPCLVEALSNMQAIQISCGANHTAAILSNGDLYTWGLGEFGALGINSAASQWSPVKVGFTSKLTPRIIQISCGTRHTSMVDEKGRLFMCGSNDSGQLGTNTKGQENTPILVSNISEKIIQAACGVYHTLILTNTNKVYTTGGNTFGQLGIGSKKSSKIPIEITTLRNHEIIKISAGHHSAALGRSGEAFIWGTGVFGEFLEPNSLSELYKLNEEIKEISIGGSFGAAISKSGQVYTWGANSSGELGVGDYNPRNIPTLVKSLQGKIVTQISCGSSSAIALGQNIGISQYGTNNIKSLTEDAKRKIFENSYKSAYMPNILPKDEKIKSAYIKKQNIDQELSELKQAQALLQAKERELEEHEKIEFSYKKSFKDELSEVEKQIAFEKEKSNNLYETLRGEQNKVYELEAEKNTLQNKLETLENELNTLEKEPQIGIESGGENLKLNEVLKEYEEKIEKEKDERIRLENEKNHEVENLKQIQNNLENAILNAKRDKEDIDLHYGDEIKKYNTLLFDYQEKLKEEERNQINLEKLHTETQFELEDAKQKISELSKQKEMKQKSLNDTSSELFELEEKLRIKKEQLEQNAEKCRQMQDNLQIKIKELQENMDLYSEKESKNRMEVEKFRKSINDKTYDNSDLENKINLKQADIDNLQKDIFAWKQVAENVNNENESLRGAIADLEEKNKKLSDALQEQERKWLKENEERAIQQIRLSVSPMKIKKILESDGQNLNYENPQKNEEKTTDQKFENLFSKSDNANIAPELRIEPKNEIMKSTEKLMQVLGTESPIRRKIAQEALSPDLRVPEKVEENKDLHNKTGSAVAAVFFYAKTI